MNVNSSEQARPLPSRRYSSSISRVYSISPTDQSRVRTGNDAQLLGARNGADTAAKLGMKEGQHRFGGRRRPATSPSTKPPSLRTSAPPQRHRVLSNPNMKLAIGAVASRPSSPTGYSHPRPRCAATYTSRCSLPAVPWMTDRDTPLSPPRRSSSTSVLNLPHAHSSLLSSQRPRR